MKHLIRGAAALALVSCAALASAHPALVDSTPKSGDVLDAAPKELRLRFSEPIEAAFTHVELIDGTGVELKGHDLELVKGDANTVVMTLPFLPGGTYRARWSAAGRDGHRVKGGFSFTVK